MGELEADTLNKVETMKNDIKNPDDNIKQLIRTLKGEDGNSGKQGELLQLEDKYKERFWKQKQKYDAQFAGGFEGSTIFSSQFTPAGWHGKIGEGTLADGILDRIIHDSYTIMIDGEESMRKRKGIM